MRSPPFVFPLSTLLAATATAQHRWVPAHAAFADGDRSVAVPAATFGFRWQILVDAAAIAPNGAMLSGIAFRSDEDPTQSGYPLANVSVALRQTATTVGAMSATFASNGAGTATTVFQGTVSLPGAGTPAIGAGPFDVVVPFAMPFAFTVAQGNLLIDIVVPGATGGSFNPGYFLDLVCGGGSATNVGVRGTFALGSSISLTCGSDPRAMTAGGSFTLTSVLANVFTPPPGAIALGLVAPPQPFDLGVLGAPGNLLHIDPQVLLAHPWAGPLPSPFPPGAWAAQLSLVVPNQPVLVGTMVYAQSATFPPSANALGLVVANAVEMRIGDAAEQLPVRLLVAEPGAPSGSFVSCAGSPTDHGAPALRLDGTFF
jgi:hypothetical protein